jgi:short-subunit dehydrogenase
MNLGDSRILITGAAGGIGACVARRLAAARAKLLLTDVNAQGLEKLAESLRLAGADVVTVVADVTKDAGRSALTARARAVGVDVLINVAGVNPFGLLAEQSPSDIERTLSINACAPMLLCQALIPVLAARASAHIVNVGSTFGAIGFPGFSVYAASKFAIRGFTEALRRELADTSIRVHYVAPRATRTALSTDRVRALNDELKIAMDTPETVARAIERTLLRGRRETYLGLTERISVVVNALLPRLVDNTVRRQLPVIRRHAARTAEPARDVDPSPASLPT